MTPRCLAHTIGVGAAMATLACHGDRPRDAPTWMRFPAPRPDTGGVQVRGPIRFSLR